MNKIIFSALLLSGVAVNAQQQQVGINTAEPKATLHVEAGASENKGVIIPRITAAEMKTMTTGLGADHHSMMTYLKEQMPTADRTGKLVDVAEPGYYYYDNTTGVQKWKTFGGAEQDFKALPTSTPGLYNYLTKGGGVLGQGTSLGTGTNNIGIGGGGTFSFLNNSNMTGSYNIAMGAGVFQLSNGGGGTMSSQSNIGIGTVLYTFNSGGSMTGNGNNIGMGSTLYRFNKSNAQFSGYSNTAIGQSIFSLQNGDLIGGNNIGMGQTQYTLNSGNMAGGDNIGIGQSSYYVQKGDITGTANNNIALGSRIYRLSNSSPSTFSGNENIGIGNALYNLSLGNLTGQRNIGMGQGVFSLSSGNLSGNSNIGIGSGAMQISGDIAGNDNIGIGSSAMHALGGIAGDYNIALGYNTMYTTGKVAGTDNIAIGYSALYSNGNTDIGSYNIGIGNWALWADMAKGNANIQLGNWFVGTPVTGQLNNVVAIGNKMYGLTVSNTDSNTILLGETGSNGPKVGIGTYKPGAKLEINNGTTAGAVKIVDGTQGAGKVLTSDANGLATWKNVTLFTGTERIGAYHWGAGTALGNTNWNKIASITVPPGASMVYVKIHLLASGLTSGAARAYVGKKDIGWNNSNTNDIPIGGSALFVSYHGIDPELQTSFIYNNTTNSNETLYLNLQSNQPTATRSGFEYPTGGSHLGTKWVENQFSAIPVN